MTKRRRHKPRWRSVYLWHRYLGLVAAAFVMLLALTGLALNHTERLGLDARPVAADWLLDWYGIAPETTPVSFPLPGGRWITWLEGRLFLDGRLIARDAGRLDGAVAVPGGFVVAEGGGLRVLDQTGATVETVPAYALPGPAEALAPGPVFASPRGAFRYDVETGRAGPSTGDADWARPADPPAGVTEAVLAAYRGDGLPLERVLLDLHSGRLFGRFGPLAMDAAAVLFVVLAGSGIVNWLVLRRRQRRR